MPQTMADFVREQGIRIGDARGDARGRMLEKDAAAGSILVDVLDARFGGTPQTLAGDVQTACAERCRERIRPAAASTCLDEFLHSIRS